MSKMSSGTKISIFTKDIAFSILKNTKESLTFCRLAQVSRAFYQASEEVLDSCVFKQKGESINIFGYILPGSGKIHGFSEEIRFEMRGEKRVEYSYGKCFFKDGKLHGLSLLYDDNNKAISLVNYQNDIKEDVSTLFNFKDELISEVYFKNGKKHGASTTFNFEEEPLDYQEYKNGLQDGKCWYKNDKGVLEHYQEYKNGKEHGLCKTWHSNGKLKNKYWMKDGKINGTFKQWDLEGSLTKFSQWREGKRHGLRKYWKGGVQTSHYEYRFGELHGIKEKKDKNGNIKVTFYRNGK